MPIKYGSGGAVKGVSLSLSLANGNSSSGTRPIVFDTVDYNDAGWEITDLTSITLPSAGWYLYHTRLMLTSSSSQYHRIDLLDSNGIYLARGDRRYGTAYSVEQGGLFYILDAASVHIEYYSYYSTTIAADQTGSYLRVVKLG